MAKKMTKKQLKEAKKQAKLRAMAVADPERVCGSWVPAYCPVTGKKQKPRKMKLLPGEKPAVKAIRSRLLTPQCASGGGTLCPMCDTIVADRERHVSPMMAAYLLLLFWWWSYAPNEFIHTNDLLDGYPNLRGRLGGGDIANLRHWELVEPLYKGTDTTDATRGCYRITLKGREFVRNETVVVRSLFFRLGEIVGTHSTDYDMFRYIIKRYEQPPKDLLLPLCPRGPSMPDPYAEDRWELQTL